MTDVSAPMKSEAMDIHGHSPGVVLRSLVIGLTAFLTVVDLFATQAILPSLTRHYNVTPAAMGLAVNASTMGMAVAGLVVGFLSPHIDRRLGILLSLVLLAIPTTLLASAPDLTVFPILRVLQGLCMASAFALTRDLVARLKGDRYLRRAEAEPGDTDRLVREAIWRWVRVSVRGFRRVWRGRWCWCRRWGMRGSVPGCGW